jgi:four helix bundle protein
MGVKHFRDLEAWQLCRDLQAAVIALVARSEVARDFKYCNQVLDASRSAASNVAEGYKRYSHGQFGQFLDVSLASIAEVQSLLEEARLRHFITPREFGDLWQLSVRADKVTSALRRSLRDREAPIPRPAVPRHPSRRERSDPPLTRTDKRE